MASHDARTESGASWTTLRSSNSAAHARRLRRRHARAQRGAIPVQARPRRLVDRPDRRARRARRAADPRPRHDQAAAGAGPERRRRRDGAGPLRPARRGRPEPRRSDGSPRPRCWCPRAPGPAPRSRSPRSSRRATRRSPPPAAAGPEALEHVLPHRFFGEFDVEEWVYFMALHSARHTAQVVEIKTRRGYPRGAERGGSRRRSPRRFQRPLRLDADRVVGVGGGAELEDAPPRLGGGGSCP